ncbi:AraC family transcriptional regulator [Mesorhizobium sp. CAU 1741]|uniref:AraC family transcriptional regulator n=1 Tax=Mesorhizobium sp. CAU 1741 TaxID=3140366 RepID=UPI00325AE3E7
MINSSLRVSGHPLAPKSSKVPVTLLGNVELVTLTVERAHTVEQLSGLAYTRADRFLLLLVESGSISVIHRNRRCELEKGQYALFDCAHSLAFEGSGDYCALGVFVPASLFQARLRHVQSLLAQPINCSGSPWRIAANHLKLLVSEVRHMPVPMAYGYGTQVIELVSIAVEADTQNTLAPSGRNAIFRRCAAYVKANAADTALGPAKIAEAMGISVRYLHKVFHEADETVCEFMRVTRLEIARKDLADPLKASVQIREIAYRVGFRSQAHFAAAFKHRYGISATEWRRETAQQLAA